MRSAVKIEAMAGRAVARALIGGGCIFIYSGSARLVSFEIKLISKEVSRAKPEYMNIHPPPPISVLATALMAGIDEGTKNAGESNNSELDHTAFTAPTSYKIMTINMRGNSAGPGTAVTRRNLLCQILKDNRCAIIFCQELPGCFEKEVVHEVDKSINYKYQHALTGDETAVVWSSKYFNGCTEGYKTTDTRIREIHKKPIESTNTGSEILTRISMVKLTVKNSTETILAVSFHGPKNNTLPENRKDVFVSLLRFLQDVVNENIHSYIIGGDFNFDTSAEIYNESSNERGGWSSTQINRSTREKKTRVF